MLFLDFTSAFDTTQITIFEDKLKIEQQKYTVTSDGYQMGIYMWNFDRLLCSRTSKINMKNCAFNH